jgi:hypothetical protein
MLAKTQQLVTLLTELLLRNITRTNFVSKNFFLTLSFPSGMNAVIYPQRVTLPYKITP